MCGAESACRPLSRAPDGYVRGESPCGDCDLRLGAEGARLFCRCRGRAFVRLKDKVAVVIGGAPGTAPQLRGGLGVLNVNRWSGPCMALRKGEVEI